MLLIDYDDLKNGVREFNSNDRDVALDTALHQATRGGLRGETIALSVFAVNSFWRANVGMQRGTLAFYCDLLNRELSDIVSTLESLRAYPLPVYDDRLLKCRIIDPAVRLVCRLLGQRGGKRHYSFASKFLHWFAGLPPFDTRVGRAVKKRTGRELAPPTRPTDCQIYVSYAGLIRYYNQFLKDLEVGHRTRDLIEFDFQTQSSHLRRRNNVVRIVDKYPWIKGA